MLTARQIEIIVEELMNGKKPTVKGDEAEKFRKQVAKEIADAKAKGLMIVMPSDLGDA